MPFSSIFLKDPVTECVICLKDFNAEEEVLQLDCHKKHVFHHGCLGPWLKEEWITQHTRTCPICRKPIKE
jgi:hypothetical protein